MTTTAAACIHRGHQLREEDCRPCGKHVRIKVFGGTLHRQCTVAKLLAGIRCCDLCPDFAAVAENPDLERPPDS